MQKLFFSLLFLLTINPLFSNSHIQGAYAIGIFDENGNGENIQHLTKTQNAYNGFCYSKIAVFGNNPNDFIEVEIGESKGYIVGNSPIYNKYKIKIGEEIAFKHFNLTSGYFKVKINHKIYDSKVFVK